MVETQKSLKMGLSGDAETAPPCVIVLFGVTGDLAGRKIAPAMYNLAREGFFGGRDGCVAIVGVGRRDWDDDKLREHVADCVREHSRSQPVDEDFLKEFLQRWRYSCVHIDEQKDYDALAETLHDVDGEFDCGGGRVFYVAMAPKFFAKVAEHLTESGLNRTANRGFVRLIVEKPFGQDFSSACELNDRLHGGFEESQIFRIDHYLGKETVQNILVFRFANLIFEPILNRHYVDNVQISSLESVGMEGRRGPYYEQAGALGDMVQNHMLQLLSLTAMEAPRAMEGEAIRDEKVKVLKSIAPMKPEEVARRTVRGQYGEGESRPAYVQEEGVAEDSGVETYAAVKLYVDNWRWSGVPFYVRTGKRLAKKVSEIVIEFKPRPTQLFTEAGCDLTGPNRLHLRIQPGEGISIAFDAKVPGARMMLRPVKMDFKYDAAFGSATPEAYEHLILDAIQGDSTLFIRNDEVEASWRLVDSIGNTWKKSGKPGLTIYPGGSWGPDAAEELFEDPYQRWHPI